MSSTVAFLDAWSPMLGNDRLFDPSSSLNRDDCTRPWVVLRDTFEAAGIPCHTADMLLSGRVKADTSLYLSIGQRQHYTLLHHRPGVRLFAYFQLEPPVVDPAGYRVLPWLHKLFDTVYTHDPVQFGGTKLFWPQVKDGLMLAPCVGRKHLCMINGNKAPHVDFSGDRELYSERVRALDHFADRCDLYGPGWERPNLGAPPDKFEVLKQYDFALCFENQQLQGYVTEKIFECMFAGTIPVYLGAPDIADYVDPDCFIDMRDFASYADLEAFLRTADLGSYRRAAAWYFGSKRFERFTCQQFAKSIVATVSD